LHRGFLGNVLYGTAVPLIMMLPLCQAGTFGDNHIYLLWGEGGRRGLLPFKRLSVNIPSSFVLKKTFQRKYNQPAKIAESL
jgi:hypothetical protein